MAAGMQSVAKQAHHERQPLCATRAKYREGRRDRAVKVYTISQESRYLLIQGIPSVGAHQELEDLCQTYGEVVQCCPLDDYPTEDFTEVYLVKYDSLQAARTAKSQLDDKSFFGGALHVCYSPEFETVQETREKLQERRKMVAARLRQLASASGTSEMMSREPKKRIAVPHRSTHRESNSGVCVWAGKQSNSDPRMALSMAALPKEAEHSSSEGVQNESLSRVPQTDLAFVPRQLIRPKKEEPQMAALAKQAGSGAPEDTGGAQRPLPSTPVSAAVDTCPDPTTGVTSMESSYDLTMASIRKRLSAVAAPNMEVTIKRRKQE